jgi:hypothetical protein
LIGQVESLTAEKTRILKDLHTAQYLSAKLHDDYEAAGQEVTTLRRLMVCGLL